MSSGKKKKTSRRSSTRKSQKKESISKSFLVILAILLVFTSLNIASSSSYTKILDITTGKTDLETLVLIKKQNPEIFSRLQKCCIPQQLQKKLQDKEEETRNLIKEYEKILKNSPQDWRIVHNLYLLYKRIGDEKMVRFYKDKLKELR